MGAMPGREPGDEALRTPRKMDFTGAVEYDPSGIVVVSPVTADGVTTVTIAADTIGVAIWAIPMLDPDGMVVSGWLKSGGLKSTPFFELLVPTADAPGATSGLDMVIGVMDGSVPASDQYVGGGIRLDSVIGPKPITASRDLPTAENPEVAGGIYAATDFSSTPSTAIKGLFIRFVRVALGLDDEGGTGGSEQSTPNVDVAKAPFVFFLVESTGVGGAAEEFSFTGQYSALFVQP